MVDGRAGGGLEDLPPIGPDGVPLADYVRALLGPDVRMTVQEPDGRTDVQLATPWWFAPIVFSIEAVSRLHDDIARHDPDTDAARFARLLTRLWRDPPPRASPLAVRMAAQRPVDLGDTPPATISYPGRRAQMIELRRLARERDLRVARLCDALRSGAIAATGFLPGDVQRQDVPIATGWWGDADLVCGWRDGELRPREGAPAGMPCFRGVRLRLAKAALPALVPIASYTTDDVKRWFLERVQAFAHETRHPSEAQDVSAAGQVFLGVHRKVIRDLRATHVPSERRRQGPSNKA